MSRPLVGLLPLYLKLYDETRPEIRRDFEPFLAKIASRFVTNGIDVVRSGICRVEAEFHEAVALFEQEEVDLIVTLHLAYSPSLEAVGALCGTDTPILLLDTTMDAAFGQDVDPARIMYNHGIHGVQDLASMLRRHGRPYEIVAGHIDGSTVLDRACGIARAARAAASLRDSRVLRIGETFKGMGDFAVEPSVLARVLGVGEDQLGREDLEAAAGHITEDAIEAEMALDRERFLVDISEDAHRRSVRAGLGLRHLLEQGEYAAFSMNFLAFDSPDGLANTVPFLEASKAMARGTGYAGEGDVLTASLVGALCQGFGATTFTEIFCPDWSGGAIFLSHMGEINPEVAAEKPRLCEKDFPWTPALNPAVLTCAPKPGPAVLVNLTPGPQDTFGLLITPVEVLGDATNPAMRDSVRGWIRPACPLERFLEEYSRHGGTHHSALVLGQQDILVESLKAFAGFIGITAQVL